MEWATCPLQSLLALVRMLGETLKGGYTVPDSSEYPTYSKI